MISLHQFPVIGQRTHGRNYLSGNSERKQKSGSSPIETSEVSRTLDGREESKLEEISFSFTQSSTLPIATRLAASKMDSPDNESGGEFDVVINKVLQLDEAMSRQEKELSALWMELTDQWREATKRKELKQEQEEDDEENEEEEKDRKRGIGKRNDKKQEKVLRHETKQANTNNSNNNNNNNNDDNDTTLKKRKKKPMTLKQLHKCAKSLINKRPIPSNVRSYVWFILSGAYDTMNSYPKHYYQTLCSQPCATQVEHDIKKDIYRTFGGQGYAYVYQKDQDMFASHDIKDTVFGEELKRLLIAYANFDKILGYCQGMNYIAAFLLKEFESEEEAFWTFLTILTDKKYYARALFMPDLPGYVKCEKALNKLLEHHLPQLYDHFQSLECLRAILSPWLHCLFAYPNIDPKITFYIWDLFLIKDFTIFLKIAFVICLVHVEKLMHLDFVDIIDFCKSTSILDKSIVRTCLHVKLDEELVRSCQYLYDESYALFPDQHRGSHDDTVVDREVEVAVPSHK
ncbi:ankyrin repeat-containing protein [Reticulomyxa filosa]|uniref:Ankyrin repeat-containing protein n=1 Tax=Reticulomyxa filosa TaxID=46433 RepID=X6MT62_RETFI|nr:ankyrin repeat-containing protein [Reticulomyxa filosa]|eukprot:ETO17178.1 ankyrin repeat-containing protein [Reticulomyxa filosa]